MNQEELLQRAAEERETIVARYKKGRQAGAEIDPWEDPQFEIYHVLDRYGFIHDQNDPDKQNQAEVRLEMERVKKWVKMLRNWDTNATKDKLRKRVFKGVPNSLRGQVWSKMLNLPTVREEQSGKYQEMRELAWRWSPDIRQIDLDVNRTYRDHIMFRERYNIKQQELFNVLGAYSVYNLEIGYCQGMSQIAALLLMYLDEEDAFWALSVLVSDRKFNMHGFFIPGFPKLLRYQEHHDKIMNKFLPKLKKHLDKNGVDTGIYTLKWFFQCFLDRIPFKLTLRVWDVYLLDGERVLTAMAYNILKMHRRNLSKRGMDDILQYLQVHLEQNYEFDEDVTMESLQKCMEELRKSKLDYAGAPPSHELPKRPFGLFKEPAFEQKVGRRSSEFSTAERTAQENVMMRRELAAATALASPPTSHGGHANGHAAQRLSSGGDVTALPAKREVLRFPFHSSSSQPHHQDSSSNRSRGQNAHGVGRYGHRPTNTKSNKQFVRKESHQESGDLTRQNNEPFPLNFSNGKCNRYQPGKSNRYVSYGESSHGQKVYNYHSNGRKHKNQSHRYETPDSQSNDKKRSRHNLFEMHVPNDSTKMSNRYLYFGHKSNVSKPKESSSRQRSRVLKISGVECRQRTNDDEFFSCESSNEYEINQKPKYGNSSSKKTAEGKYRNDQRVSDGNFLSWNRTHRGSQSRDPVPFENSRTSRSRLQTGIRFQIGIEQLNNL